MIEGRNKGKNNPMYGHHHSEETKNKLRGENNGMYGKHHSEEAKKKMSDAHLKNPVKHWLGKQLTEEHKKNIGTAVKIILSRPDMKKKMSDAMKKENNSFYGKHHSEETKKRLSEIAKRVLNRPETKKRMRISAINRISRMSANGNQVSPSYNPNACKLIDEYGKQNGYNFRHAMNGGEFHIKELGYFVDGYDNEKNVVIEYYEKSRHDKLKQIERDKQRLNEIIDVLKCKVIIIKEWEEFPVIIN